MEQHDDVGSENITSLLNFVLADTPYNVRCKWWDANAAHGRLMEPGIVALVILFHDVMCAGSHLHIFLVRYNLR